MAEWVGAVVEWGWGAVAEWGLGAVGVGHSG